MVPQPEKDQNRFSYNLKSDNGITIFEVNGELDMYTLPRAVEIVDMLVEQGKVNVLMDLGRLEFIDSAGLGFFAGTLKRLRDKNGELKLINLNPYVKRIFELIHLDYFISVYDDPKAAYADFRDNISSAILKWKKVTELKPNYADAYYQLGCAYLGKGMQEEAISEFEHALRVNPFYSEAHKALGDCLKESGDLDNAVDHYRKAIEIKPDYADALMSLGIAYNDKTMIDDALEHYKKALQANPHYADVHNQLGVAYLAKGDFENGEQAFKQAIGINIAFVEAHKNLGNLYVSQGKNKDAIGAFNEAVKYSSVDKEIEDLRNQIRKLMALTK